MFSPKIYLAQLELVKHCVPTCATDYLIQIDVAGCNFKCKDCSHPHLWNLDLGIALTIEQFESILLSNKNILSLCGNQMFFAGGEPYYSDEYQEFIKIFLERNPQYDVAINTGRELSEITKIYKNWGVRPFITKYGKFNPATLRKNYHSYHLDAIVTACPHHGLIDRNLNHITSSDGIYVRDCDIELVRLKRDSDIEDIIKIKWGLDNPNTPSWTHNRIFSRTTNNWSSNFDIKFGEVIFPLKREREILYGAKYSKLNFYSVNDNWMNSEEYASLIKMNQVC